MTSGLENDVGEQHVVGAWTHVVGGDAVDTTELDVWRSAGEKTGNDKCDRRCMEIGAGL